MAKSNQVLHSLGVTPTAFGFQSKPKAAAVGLYAPAFFGLLKKKKTIQKRAPLPSLTQKNQFLTQVIIGVHPKSIP